MARTNFDWIADYPRVLADITGNGTPDIVGFGPDGVWISYNQGATGFTEPGFGRPDFAYNDGWRINAHPRFAADLTGDGHADLLGFGEDGVWVALNSGKQPPVFSDGGPPGVPDTENRFGAARFVLAEFGTSKGWAVDRHPRMLADLRGNGRLDIVGFGDDGVWVALGAGDGSFEEARLVVSGFCFNQGWHVDVHARFLADTTGDGRPDIVGFGDDGLWVALNNGDGTFASPVFAFADFGVNKGWRSDQHPRFLADLTGDGRADIIGFGENGVWVAFNAGDGSFQPPAFFIADFGVDKGWRVDQHLRLVTDVTGDGRADIVCFGNDGVWVSLNQGDGTFHPPRFMADFSVGQGWQVDHHPRFVTRLSDGGPASIIGFGDDGVWTAVGDGGGGFAPPGFVQRAFGRLSNRDLTIREDVVRPTTKSKVKHVFVLMMENRSFDHMLGYSGITGTDIATGQPTAIDGVTSEDGNSFRGTRYKTRADGSDRQGSPGHSFPAVLEQLCGPGARYPSGGPYPTINNSGYVSHYASKDPKASPHDVMRCFTRQQLPVLDLLAREFLVCDRWFSATPGPTEPNRMFVHAASSGRYDGAPEDKDIGVAATVGGEGWTFRGGDVFDSLRKAGVKFRIYADDDFPNVAEQRSISRTFDVEDFADFADDLKKPSFDASYVFIEPSYGIVWAGAADLLGLDGPDTFFNGNSQHPPGSVAAGERFIKAVYEAIRNSPVWESSMLVVTWDEHGGFYDHVSPPTCQNAGETGKDHGFTFEQLGPRVPTIIISPLIPKNTISHLKLEHSSVVQTLVDLFGLKGLEHSRVATGSVSGFSHFATLSTARTDAPRTLDVPMPALAKKRVPFAEVVPVKPDSPIEGAPDGAFTTLRRNLLVQHLKLEPEKKNQILARHRTLKTEADLVTYAKEVVALVKQRKQSPP